MKKPDYIKYGYYAVKGRIRKKYIGIYGEDKYYESKRRYAGGYVLPLEETSQFLSDSIKRGRPFFAGRFGANELNAVAVFDNRIEKKYQKIMTDMCNGAGFFPEEKEALIEFKNLMINSMGGLDYLAIWNLNMEDYYIRKYAPKIVMSRLRYFEPWYADHPWTKALEGKKVLVIHPFEETIRSQYQRRDYLFEKRYILPEFTLYTQKAVQTIAGCKDYRFETWFDALDYMYQEAMKTDFEVALIGCGAYGFPLAAKIKEGGRQAIHLGGALQLLFGIKGARWDSNPVVSSMYNEYWVRASESERPQNFTAVESGCYW